MTAIATVESIITAASTRADTALDAAIEYGDTAQTVAGATITGLAPVPSPTEPSVTIPVFADPGEDLGNEFRAQYENVNDALDADLASKLTSYLSTYFPSFTGCISTFQSWLCNQITSGGTGVNSAVEDALWQRGRDRLSKAQSAEEDGLLDEWAGRGWNIPSGALVDTVARSQQALADKVGDLNRDITIKQFETEVEMTKFAIEQYRIFYLGALDTIRQFLLLAIESVNAATRNAAEYTESKRKLWQAVDSYYRALVSAAGLTLEYDKLVADIAIKGNDQFVEGFKATIAARVNAAVGSAEALGKTAAAYAGAQNALAEVSHQTQATE